MSATSYYSTKARVGARTERIRGEMDKSSAYILEGGSLNSSNYSSKPSYSSSTMGRFQAELLELHDGAAG